MTKEYELHTLIAEVMRSIDEEIVSKMVSKMVNTKEYDKKFKNLCSLSFVHTILASKKNKYLTERDASYLSDLRATLGIEGLLELQTKELNFETI